MVLKLNIQVNKGLKDPLQSLLSAPLKLGDKCFLVEVAETISRSELLDQEHLVLLGNKN